LRWREGRPRTSGQNDIDELWMRAALVEARKAYDEGEVPVGAVVVVGDRVVGRGHNQVESLGDPTAHAEILAIGAASQTLGVTRLTEASIYVTMEPCPLGNIVDDPALNHRATVRSGVLEEECAELLSRFFVELRRRSTA